MEAFKLHREQLSYRVRPSSLTKKESSEPEHQESPNHPLPSCRKGKVAVHLQHRMKEIYSVFTAHDGPSGEVVNRKEKVLGRQHLHLECGAAHTYFNGLKIVVALSCLGVEISGFRDTIIDKIKSLIQRHDHDEITVDFLTCKMYRCFEEVADSW